MHNVNFAPNNKEQVRALVRYLNKHSSSVQVQRAEPAYIAAVRAIQAQMREYFAAFPPVRTSVCAWRTQGTYEACRALAVQYSVPAWTVLADANPYSGI